MKTETRYVYQNIIDVSSQNKIIGFECLLRILDPYSGQFKSPNALFLHWLENNPFATNYYKNCIFNFGLDLSSQNSDVYGTVNVSPRMIENKEFIYDMVNLNKLFNSRFKFEITERSKISNWKVFIKNVEYLHSNSIEFFLDDFDPEMLNLGYLQNDIVSAIKLPLHGVVSVDEKMVKDVEFVLSISEKFSVNIIAEGVENYKISCFLKKAGINIQQGFFWGKPLALYGKYKASLNEAYV